MRGLAAALVCVFSAGCLDAADTLREVDDPMVGPPGVWVFDATGTSLSPALFPGGIPSFALSQVNDRLSGEPTVGVTRTGAIFTTAVDFDVLPENPVRNFPKTWYMRSTDGGDTWHDKSPHVLGVKTHTDTADNYVYVDPTTGRVFALDMTPHLLCNKVSWSDDDGASWTTRDGACIPGINDNPTLFAGPATSLTNRALYPNQLYLCVNRLSDNLCYQSPDGGLTWPVATPSFLGVDPDPDGVDCLLRTNAGHGHASFTDGTVYLGRGVCDVVEMAVSHNGGMTFQTVAVAQGGKDAPASFDVMVASDAAGVAYALWVGDRVQPGSYNPEGRAVRLAVSHDRGLSWSKPLNVTAPGVTAVKFPAIVAGAEGRIAFSFVGSETPSGWGIDMCEGDETGRRTCKVLLPEEYESATWNAYVGMSLGAASESPTFVLVRTNAAHEPLKRGGCIERCRGDEGAMMDFLDIDIDPMTGQVFAAFVDVCSGECDGPGKKTSDVYQRSVGVVAVQTAGPFLLEAPIPERQTGNFDLLTMGGKKWP